MPTEKESASKPKWRTVGITLVVLSFILYGALFLVPFIPVSGAAKVGISTALIVFGEITFWLGGILLGKELISRYKRYFNPKHWFKKREDDPTDVQSK
jgi:hypothetical protein